MATHWWRVVTNPSFLTDDELHAIMDADYIVLSLTPSDPTTIPETVTFCQVIGVLHRVWRTSQPRYSYINGWINLDEAGNDAIDWNAFGRDHARNLATLRRATAIARFPPTVGPPEGVFKDIAKLRRATAKAHSPPLVGPSEGVKSLPITGQISDRMRRLLQRETYVFFHTHIYFFQHAETDIYVVQVFEKHAWGIHLLLRGRINGAQRTLISVPALAHLSLDLTTIVPSIKRARSMLEVDEY
ncbi:hypothetical protein FOMPIDRAFT_1041075 [Fomitopsis schrenkii]|uniref:Uncharacterized protein n=1 Tax=Fomitopsis schrenkii TaxID=2126942 RepID=S8EA94_FOMSC|nr:hypothetical protein FOMPIDRAFT_1041075 [Fomitopsis schrenkii]